MKTKEKRGVAGGGRRLLSGGRRSRETGPSFAFGGEKRWERGEGGTEGGGGGISSKGKGKWGRSGREEVE